MAWDPVQAETQLTDKLWDGLVDCVKFWASLEPQEKKLVSAWRWIDKAVITEGLLQVESEGDRKKL